METKRLRVYCSGPLFCPEEVGGMQAIADALEASGMETFLPHRDGLEAYVLRFAGGSLQNAVPRARRAIERAVFALDVYELTQRCDAIVFNLNGRVPDEGGIVESTIAFCCDRPLVLYKHDARAPFAGSDNAMLTGLTGGRIVNEIGTLPGAISELCANGGRPRSLDGNLARVAATGQRVASVLERLPENRWKQRWPTEVIDAVIDVSERELDESEDSG